MIWFGTPLNSSIVSKWDKAYAIECDFLGLYTTKKSYSRNNKSDEVIQLEIRVP
jgi:hypothetical protein